jgi:hypothetical protein
VLPEFHFVDYNDFGDLLIPLVVGIDDDADRDVVFDGCVVAWPEAQRAVAVVLVSTRQAPAPRERPPLAHP